MLVNGVPVPGIVVLNADGSVDTNFMPPSFEQELYPETYALQSDGKVYVSGDFTSVNNEARTILTETSREALLIWTD